MKIHCPQCDALIDVGTDRIIRKCPYCGVHLVYRKGVFLSRESIKPTHHSSVAVKLLKNFAGKKLTVEMEYFPFYRIVREGETHFIPGKAIDLYGIDRYVPRGDRVPLTFDVEEPEYSVDVALDMAGLEKADSIVIVYLPFFTALDGDTIYYVDAATGNILSNTLLSRREVNMNKHPLAILNWLIVSLLVLFLPFNPILKIFIAISITVGFYFFEYQRENV